MKLYTFHFRGGTKYQTTERYVYETLKNRIEEGAEANAKKSFQWFSGGKTEGMMFEVMAIEWINIEEVPDI